MAVKDPKIDLQNHEFSSYCSAPKHGPATLSRVSLFIVSVLLCSSPLPDVPRWCPCVYGNRTPGNRALPRASKRTNERPRDVTNRIRFFPGPATVAEFLCFYFFLALCFILFFLWSWTGTAWIPSFLPGWWRNTSARKERDRDTVDAHCCEPTPLLELGNRKRTILFSPNPSLHLSSLSNRRRSGCPPRRKPSFYVFVLLSFSDTLYPQNRTEPNRTNTIGTIESGEDLGP